MTWKHPACSPGLSSQSHFPAALISMLKSRDSSTHLLEELQDEGWGAGLAQGSRSQLVGAVSGEAEESGEDA